MLEINNLLKGAVTNNNVNSNNNSKKLNNQQLPINNVLLNQQQNMAANLLLNIIKSSALPSLGVNTPLIQSQTTQNKQSSTAANSN